jgi:hypothetical protein
MKTRRQSRPEPEHLEDRALLSSLAHPHLAHPVRPVSVASAHPVSQTSPLQGSVTGSYDTKVTPAVAGRDLSLSGNGDVNSIGSVQLTGVIHTGVSKAKAAPSGNLVLTDSQGTIRLSLRGNGGRQPLSTSSLAIPVSANSMQLRYTIVGGTGAYRNFRGSGTVSLTLTPDTHSTLPPTPVTGGSGSTTTGGSDPGSSSGTGTGTGTNTGTGTGTTTLPPAPVPPGTTTGGGKSIGKPLPPSKVPPAHTPGHVKTGTGAPGQPGSGAVVIKASAVTPGSGGAATFLKGRFTLVFNGSPSIVPMPL